MGVSASRARSSTAEFQRLKTIALPSGEKLGAWSWRIGLPAAEPSGTACASVPSAAVIQIDSSQPTQTPVGMRPKASVAPSGDTAGESSSVGVSRKRFSPAGPT